MGFQYPVAIPGLSNVQFLRAALNAARRARSEPPLDALDCLKRIKEQLQILEIPETWLSRGLNEGFSGGEKKRNELLQWALLKPKLAIFDEMDSGLDIDALKSIAQAIHRLRAPDQSLLLITHYPRLLELVRPDRVHVLIAGKIVQSGDQQLACDLERSGYAAYSEIPARAL